MTVRTAAELGVPETFNVATWFVDRHVGEGRGERIAIECGDDRITYRDVVITKSQPGVRDYSGHHD